MSQILNIEIWFSAVSLSGPLDGTLKALKGGNVVIQISQPQVRNTCVVNQLFFKIR